MEKRLVCILCPLGCNITTKTDGEVQGNRCDRGVYYAISETSNKYIINSTIKVINGNIKRVMVKTNREIPKERFFDCISEINKKEVIAPIKIGEILIKDCANTGVDIIALEEIKGINMVL